MKPITYNGAIRWNKLPNNVKAANMSTSQFEAVLDCKFKLFVELVNSVSFIVLFNA